MVPSNIAEVIIAQIAVAGLAFKPKLLIPPEEIADLNEFVVLHCFSCTYLFLAC